MANWLIGIGLVANMAGTATVFFVGFPQRSIQDPYRVRWGGPSEDEVEVESARRQQYSLGGLVLLFIGFALQLAGLIAQP